MKARFFGTFEYSVDAKGRINMPAKFRKAVSEESLNTFYLLPSPGKCLRIYPADVWCEEVEKMRALPQTPTHVAYRRKLYRNLTECEVDGQGRITLTSKQMAYAEVTQGKATLVGMGEYIELVSPEAFAIDDDAAFDELFFEVHGE